LIRQEATALDTVTFYFERPVDFQFAAGQFVEIRLPDSDLLEADRIHTFSISSAPYEDCIAITTRLRESSFKRALSLLERGDAVEVEGPYGRFVVGQDTPRPIAFLIGGVGITPVYSIVKQAAHDSGLAGFFLFYSNRSRADAPFLSELIRLDAENPEFQLIATMTADSSWAGEKDRLGIDMIKRHVDPTVASFYTSGPPGMVTAMREMLAQNGVPSQGIRFETFSGY
jgi:ferredoxin-NADP reductase